MWREQEGCDLPFVGAHDLAELKKTNREKDYAVIGELARMLHDPTEQLLLSRSARDLILLAKQHAGLVNLLIPQRTVLAAISRGRAKLEAALDGERRMLIRLNEQRLESYAAAAKRWSALWTELAGEVASLPLPDAHRIVVSRAAGVLPFAPAKIER